MTYFVTGEQYKNEWFRVRVHLATDTGVLVAMSAFSDPRPKMLDKFWTDVVKRGVDTVAAVAGQDKNNQWYWLLVRDWTDVVFIGEQSFDAVGEALHVANDVRDFIAAQPARDSIMVPQK